MAGVDGIKEWPEADVLSGIRGGNRYLAAMRRSVTESLTRDEARGLCCDPPLSPCLLPAAITRLRALFDWRCGVRRRCRLCAGARAAAAPFARQLAAAPGCGRAAEAGDRVLL